MPPSPRTRSSSRARGAGRYFPATSSGGGNGGGATYPDPVVLSVAGSGQVNTDNAIAYSIDNSDYNRWLSNTSSGTLTFTLTTGAVATSYQISTPWGGNNAAPRDWTFQGSNDGTNWTVLDTQSGVTTWVQGATRTFDVANTTSYLYYRIVFTANNGGANLGLSEMKLKGRNAVARLGGTGGTMVDWWRADAITGRADGATVLATDLTDQVGTHDFSNAVGVCTYRATGGPNNLPAVESAVTGAGFYQAGQRQKPGADQTFFMVLKVPNTNLQQVFGAGPSGAAVDLYTGKVRMMKQGVAQLAISTTSYPTGTWFILVVKYNSTTGATSFRIITSSTDTTDSISGTATTFPETGDLISWGCYDTTTGAAFQGSIEEMGRYASVLDSTDTATLVGALKTKVGFP